MDQKNIITLGTYPQNSELHEPIEWIVLKQETGRVLCISKFLLDCRPYHVTAESITWEKCSLRRWLNDHFFNTAFTKEEQNRIQVTDIETPLHDTKDHIFLLSCEEAEIYFDFDERAARTTPYARKQGAWFLDDSSDKYFNNGSWWLRYPDILDEYIKEGKSGLYTILSCVNFDGYIEGGAVEASGTNCCIRPAFWLTSEK